jgi:hypothetical protein
MNHFWYEVIIYIEFQKSVMLDLPDLRLLHISTNRLSHLSDGSLWQPCPPVSSTNKTELHSITEILLKVALKQHKA